MTARIKLTRLGSRLGDHDLEPSCGVMDIRTEGKHYRIVVDCGFIPMRGAEAAYNLPDLSHFDDGKKIDAVCITHIHGDHAGYLPALSRFLAADAKIWMTSTSEAMIRRVFDDAYVSAAKADTNAPFSPREVEDINRRVRRIFKPGASEVLPGIMMFVWPEGHINGACSFTFLVSGKRVHFSGDRCGHNQPGVKGAVLLPDEWRPHVIANSDCTYGADPDSDRRSWREEMDKGLDLCAETIRRGAPVLFCAFGVHRGGVVAHELSRRGLPSLAPAYLDGSCRHFTEIVQDAYNHWSEADTLLHLDGIRWIHHEECRRVDAVRDRAYMAVSTPGMGGPGGAACFWRRHVLPNPDALLVFTGYLAPETDGARILAAEAERRKTGGVPVMEFEDRDRDGQPRTERLPLRCRILQIRIGSHDSRGKILEWFRGYRPETAVLCHGSMEAMASLEAGLQGDVGQIIRSDRQKSVEIEF